MAKNKETSCNCLSCALMRAMQAGSVTLVPLSAMVGKGLNYMESLTRGVLGSAANAGIEVKRHKRCNFAEESALRAGIILVAKSREDAKKLVLAIQTDSRRLRLEAAMCLSVRSRGKIMSVRFYPFRGMSQREINPN